MTEQSKNPRNPIWAIAWKAVGANVLFPLLGSGFAYAAYTDDLGVSQWPWRIGMLFMAFGVLFPLTVSAIYARTKLLWVYGLVALTLIVGIYFFFGVVFFLYYVIFAPMPAVLHWLSLFGGVGVTAYWIIMSWQTISHTIARTSFVRKAFWETESGFEYQPQSAMVIFDKLNKERQPFPKFYFYIVIGVGPFGLLLERLLSSSFGTGGVVFFLAVLALPLSLWFAGVVVRVYLVMIRLPRDLQCEHRKPVIVVE